MVLSTSLSGLIGPGVTTLPAGVILSLRSVEVTGSGLTIRGALGAFDGVFSKFPRPPSTGRCFIAAAATSESSAEVLVLQDFRDTRLLPSRMGARLVWLYEAFSPAIANRVRTNRILAVTVRYVVVKPAAAFARLALGLMSMLGEGERPGGTGVERGRRQHRRESLDERCSGCNDAEQRHGKDCVTRQARSLWLRWTRHRPDHR